MRVIATFSFLDCLSAITGPGGAINLGAGAAVAEEGITIEREEDKSTLVVGADGTPMHSLHAGNAGTVNVRLLKTSPVNAMLEAMYNFQRLSSALWGINVVTTSNFVTGDIITCTFVAFRRHPNITYAKEGGMNEWTFAAGSIDAILGVAA